MEAMLVYLTLINAAAFVLMHADKKKAIQGKWRIPERVLLTFAALGGSLGAFLGMQLFRHKTKHPKFSIGLPAMLAVHTGICLYLLK